MTHPATRRRVIVLALGALVAACFAAPAAGATNLTVSTDPSDAGRVTFGSFVEWRGIGPASNLDNADLDADLDLTPLAGDNVGISDGVSGDGTLTIAAPVTCSACTTHGLWMSAGLGIAINAMLSLGTGELQSNGTTTIAAAVSSGEQRWLGPVTFASGGSTDSTSTARFQGTISGTEPATISTVDGATFEGDVTMTGATGSLDLTGPATLKDIDVTTGGGQHYRGPVTLAPATAGPTPPAISLHDDLAITFDDALDGDAELDVAGATSFKNVGAVTPLASLSAGSAAGFTGTTVHTSGTQTYAGTLTFTTNAQVQADGGLTAGTVRVFGVTPTFTGDASIGPVTQNGGIAKAGTGDLTLNGTSTYTGATTVTGDGRFVLLGSATSAITVNAGTLVGTGSTTELATINADGVLQPGSTSVPSSGTLTVGDLEMAAGSYFVASVDGATVPKLATDSVDLGGADLQVDTDMAPLMGATATIIDNTGGGAVTGTFAGLPEGAITSRNSVGFRISYVGGTGNDVTITRVKVPTRTTLTQSASSTLARGSVQFTAGLDESAATGTVDFRVDGASIGSAAVAAGVAQLSTTTLAVGAHDVVAVYSGDGSFTGSTSSSIAHSVARIPTSTSLTASSTVGLAGARVTFTATSTAAATPDGTVTFSDGATELGSVALDAGGIATLAVSNLAAGSHSISARLAAGATFAESSTSTVSYSVLSLGKVRVTGACLAKARSPLTLKYAPSIAAKVTITVARLSTKKAPKCTKPNTATGALTPPKGTYKAVRSTSFNAKAGAQSKTLAMLTSAKQRTPGTYRITIVARTASGVATKPVTLGFVITGA